jgi:hypothetical protein
MDKKTVGSCLCGSITFEISGPFESFFLCHCSRCRKDTGAAYAANLFSTAAEITWLSGQNLIKTYQLPSTRHQKSFCSNCGSAIPSIQLEGALLAVPAGSLDSAIDMRPDAHICFGSRAAWDRQIEDIPEIDDLPG